MLIVGGIGGQEGAHKEEGGGDIWLELRRMERGDGGSLRTLCVEGPVPWSRGGARSTCRSAGQGGLCGVWPQCVEGRGHVAIEETPWA